MSDSLPTTAPEMVRYVARNGSDGVFETLQAQIGGDAAALLWFQCMLHIRQSWAGSNVTIRHA